MDLLISKNRHSHHFCMLIVLDQNVCYDALLTKELQGCHLPGRDHPLPQRALSQSGFRVQGFKLGSAKLSTLTLVQGASEMSLVIINSNTSDDHAKQCHWDKS